MSAPQLACVCGCPAGRHLMGRRDCRSCQTCSEYEPAEAQPQPVALDVTALLGEVQDDVSRERELTDRLAEAERDRDRLDRALRDLAGKRDALQTRLEQAEQYARDLQDHGDIPANERLYDTHVRHLCPICGGRYREHHNHPCGPLVPVRVRITFIEE